MNEHDETVNLETLAAAAASGDLKIADQLIRATHDHLFAFLHVRGIPERDIEDVAEKAMMQMYQSLGKYDRSRPFLPWFRAIARNVTSEYWKAQKREGDRLSVFQDYVRISEASESEGENDGRILVQTAALRECVEKLEDGQKRLIVLRYYEDRDSVEIGRATGMKPATVRRMLARVREILRRCVEAQTPAEG